jgi:ribosome-binding factor A
MSSRKSRKGQLRPLCGEIHRDDGVDPRKYFSRSSRKPDGRKTLQLCAQAARALNAFLAECGDDVLSELRVASVSPAPGPESLLVMVEMGPACRADPERVLATLRRAAGRMRWELGESLTRKRVPEIRFRVASSGEGDL